MALRQTLTGTVSPERYVRWTRAALWSLTIIVISGGAVRLTGSGLGCSDWPNCEDDRFVADLEYHALIEFVNRLFTGVVTVAVVLAVLGSLRRAPRRADLVRWSWGLVAGVAAQIVLGAVLVKTELDPRFTMGHFLLSMVLLWNAVVLHHRAAWADGDGGTRLQSPAVTLGEPRHRDGLRELIRAVSVVGAGLLVTGTIVTGSGPHSGSDEPEVAARLPFLVREVTRIHSIVAIVLLLLVLETTRRARNAGRDDVGRRAAIVASLLVVQGAVGYWQYFAGVPVLLVGVHITLASLAWINIVRLHLSLVPGRDGGSGTGARAMTAPLVVPDIETDDDVDLARPWKVIVWDDPINLMSYVAFVFQKLFGFSKEKAHRLMLAVHNDGKAVVTSGSKEKAELDVFRLHEHGLWATMEQD